ncbi:hypothetical protein PP187_gp047 [Klebsiella phage vB_KvM-Eowyn]|uniref:Uncharacterized protein n=1 Tax=Klebsiella phage vB_KvM-Eowyn TaxID=2762819 RepID=A0A7R8MJF3_9CAUD|nr:hypothetical protein PP187_gp047 [Klebsiella phage vB_KvM-Eowyn]CAD5236036.1 hypothetical protein LLCLJKAH_00047 [Klebsiella phage vB_KvM-Eowyn]
MFYILGLLSIFGLGAISAYPSGSIVVWLVIAMAALVCVLSFIHERKETVAAVWAVLDVAMENEDHYWGFTEFNLAPYVINQLSDSEAGANFWLMNYAFKLKPGANGDTTIVELTLGRKKYSREYPSNFFLPTELAKA